jgi:hypothetical protein
MDVLGNWPCAGVGNEGALKSVRTIANVAIMKVALFINPQ